MLPVWCKPLLWLACLLPLLGQGMQLALALHADAGLNLPVLLPLAQLLQLRPAVNPVEHILRDSGLWALRLLCLTLCLTPLRRWTGWTGWIRLRRLLGLFAFFYASLHLALYVGLEQSLDLGAVLRDVLKRPFITAGMVAFVLLLPLAATSTQAAMRRLGRRWQQLHRLVYLILPVAVLHFWWMVKRDISEPALYAGLTAILLGLRLYWARRPPQQR